MNKIHVELGEKTAIKRILKVNAATIKKALDGEGYSRKAYEIRKLALERGGIELPEKPKKQENG